MPNKSYKGRRFEIWLAAELSRWWTQDLLEPREDIFWHTGHSGGRATRRTAQGKSTKNQYGDIYASDPIGQPLLELVTIEAKKGYSKCSIADLLDKAGVALQQYEKWIHKAIADHKAAGSYSWLLITKRDKREPLVFLSCDLIADLAVEGFWRTLPFARFEILKNKKVFHFICTTFKAFLKSVQPEHFRKLAKEMKK